MGKNRRIWHENYAFEINRVSNTPGKFLSLFRMSHDIEKETYRIKNLSITEQSVDGRLRQMLREQQWIKNLIEKSPEKEAFYVYGNAHGESVRVSESRTRRSGWRFGLFSRFFSVGYQPGYSELWNCVKTRTDDVFAYAVLRLTLERGVLEIAKLTEEAHFELSNNHPTYQIN